MYTAELKRPVSQPLAEKRAAVEELLDVHFHDDALLLPRVDDAAKAAEGLVR